LVDFEDVVTCLPVVQEVLQGFRSEAAVRRAERAIFSLPIVDSPMPEEVYRAAVDPCRTGRATGSTIRSSVDCLVAASAMRHDLEVLHRDRDYDRIARFAWLRQREV
jgi:predicted nucleic acid-binding protein